jgi:hypothetical protein
LAKKHKIYVQNVAGIVDLPEEYRSRVQKIATNLHNITLMTLDPYDLLLSKLSRNSPKDREDAKFLIGELHLAFVIFQERWGKEMAPWIPNADRHRLTVQLWEEYFTRSA